MRWFESSTSHHTKRQPIWVAFFAPILFCDKHLQYGFNDLKSAIWFLGLLFFISFGADGNLFWSILGGAIGSNYYFWYHKKKETLKEND